MISPSLVLNTTLAKALGWKQVSVCTDGSLQDRVVVSEPPTNEWKTFDYRDPGVYGPLSVFLGEKFGVSFEFIPHHKLWGTVHNIDGTYQFDSTLPALIAKCSVVLLGPEPLI